MAKNKFPTSKAGQIALGQAVINGFTVAADDFPAPTVSIDDLKLLLAAAIAKRNARITADAAAAEALEDENEAFEALNDALKTDIKYAELVTKGDDAKLQQISWSGRAAAKTPAAPGAPGAFEVVQQGKGWAHFDWKTPKTGGKALMFSVLMKETGAAGDWKVAGSSVNPENTITNLESGKEYIFCVVGVNAAGTGEQSNAVTLFL